MSFIGNSVQYHLRSLRKRYTILNPMKNKNKGVVLHYTMKQKTKRLLLAKFTWHRKVFLFLPRNSKQQKRSFKYQSNKWAKRHTAIFQVMRNLLPLVKSPFCFNKIQKWVLGKRLSAILFKVWQKTSLSTSCYHTHFFNPFRK